MKDFKEILALFLIMLLVGVVYVSSFSPENYDVVKTIISIFIIAWSGVILVLLLRSKI